MSSLVINLLAGPGAGKTTGAMEICVGLKKLNASVEYVPEYAKELVWDGRDNLLDGSFANQLDLLLEQNKRISRLNGQADFIVTDSPLLLQLAYIKENPLLFDEIAFTLHEQYRNYNIFIERGNHFEQQGRIHNLDESAGLDSFIKERLAQFDVPYSSYTHEMIPNAAHSICSRFSPALHTDISF